MNAVTKISLTQPEYSAFAKKAIARAPSHFINGQWVFAQSDKTIDVFDPSTGKVISQLADATDAEVDLAVAAARTAFDDGRWTGLPPVVRESMMLKLADLLEQNAQQFAELEAIDNGKPVAIAAAVDLPGAIGMLRYMAGWATKLSGEMIDPMSAPQGAFHAYVRREPVGVAAQIVPWNFPLLMAILKIAPALAAGCTLVLKPAEQTSLTALRLADLVIEAGFPAGVINIITGLGETAGDRLVRHPDVDKIAFTGSTEVGKIINRNATDTLKRVTLELGGKSPVVIDDGADIEKIAADLASAKQFNGGQACICPDYVFVKEAQKARLVEAFKARVTENLYAEDGRIKKENIAQIVNKANFARVKALFDDAVAKGATIAVGGKLEESDLTVHPTLLTDVTPDMDILKEEIFAPLLPVMTYGALDEVIAYIEARDKPLALYVYSDNEANVQRLLDRTSSGGVTVNGVFSHYLENQLPFGGVGQSGTGSYHGYFGFKAFSHERAVYLHR